MPFLLFLHLMSPLSILPVFLRGDPLCVDSDTQVKVEVSWGRMDEPANTTNLPPLHAAHDAPCFTLTTKRPHKMYRGFITRGHRHQNSDDMDPRGGRSARISKACVGSLDIYALLKNCLGGLLYLERLLRYGCRIGEIKYVDLVRHHQQTGCMQKRLQIVSVKSQTLNCCSSHLYNIEDFVVQQFILS
jgi:hypothetical protein